MSVISSSALNSNSVLNYCGYEIKFRTDPPFHMALFTLTHWRQSACDAAEAFYGFWLQVLRQQQLKGYYSLFLSFSTIWRKKSNDKLLCGTNNEVQTKQYRWIYRPSTQCKVLEVNRIQINTWNTIYIMMNHSIHFNQTKRQRYKSALLMGLMSHLKITEKYKIIDIDYISRHNIYCV